MVVESASPAKARSPMTNRIGDMLREMRNPNLSRRREDEIVRLLNELGEREEKYKETLAVDGKIFNRPKISTPRFLTTALASISFERTTNTSITSGVDTYVSWEAAKGSNQNFYLDKADPTKIHIVFPGQAFFILGRTAFASNATGFRNTKVEAFDVNDVSLGVMALLYNTPGWSGSDNVSSYGLLIPENLVTNLSYIKATVGQTSGAALNLQYIFFGMAIG